MSKDKYASERYNPTLPYCGEKIKLFFNGERLVLFGLMYHSIPFSAEYRAVSGITDRNGKFDYSLENQKKKDRGPIPEGNYWIKPDEFWENAWYKRALTSSWGNFRITLHPFTNTETYGRGGFFIHGGSTPGSKGCVDLTGEMDRFYKNIQFLIGDNSNCQIELIVAYKGVGMMKDGTLVRRHILR